MIGRLAAAALRVWSAPRARAFIRALDDPARAQADVLARLLRVSAGSTYGRSLGLRSNDSLDVFRAKVPLVGYDDIEPWIARQRHGEPGALVTSVVACYEKTSGSSGPAKYIPYTDALLRSFRNLFCIWAHDLLTNDLPSHDPLTRGLRPRSGHIFISVSPHFRDECTTSDGIPVGLEQDSDYLGPALRALIGRFLVVPPGTRLPSEPQDFRDVLACFLVAESGLEVVSVWSPTYLQVLLDHFQQRRDTLLPALAAGEIGRGGHVYRFPRTNSPRLSLLERDPIDWGRAWPRLQLLSCWAGAASSGPARRLQALLPNVFLQPKGLLATEAPVTLPLVAAGGCVPLVDEVLLEFSDGERERLIDELEPEGEYEIVLSQCGGLLRYRLGDRVRVTGSYRKAPLLEFLGRAEAVCDLVGEKLHEDFVASALEELGCGRTLALLLPISGDAAAPHYHLLVEGSTAPDGARLDAALQRAHHYRVAQQLGQLVAARTTGVPDLGARLHRFYTARGQAAGDIKDRRLVTAPALGLALYRQILEADDRAAQD